MLQRVSASAASSKLYQMRTMDRLHDAQPRISIVDCISEHKLDGVGSWEGKRGVNHGAYRFLEKQRKYR